MPNKQLEQRLSALEQRQLASDQARRLHTAATAANDQPLHWSERREWKELLNLFRLASIYNELPARFDATGRCVLPTSTRPALTAATDARHQALIDWINQVRDAGGTVVLLTLSELEAARVAPTIRPEVEKAIAAWQAQTGEPLDTPIARVEWLDQVWRAWTDESETDPCLV